MPPATAMVWLIWCQARKTEECLGPAPWEVLHLLYFCLPTFLLFLLHALARTWALSFASFQPGEVDGLVTLAQEAWEAGTGLALRPLSISPMIALENYKASALNNKNSLIALPTEALAGLDLLLLGSAPRAYFGATHKSHS